MNKKILIFLMLSIFCLSLVSAANDSPPPLLNHQFYGDITWDKESLVPIEVSAKIGDKTFTSKVSSLPCLVDPCKGTYGSDSNNILRVQGNNGEIVSFFVDNVKAGEATYQNDQVTKLNLDLRDTPETPDKKQTGSSTKTKNVTRTVEPVKEVVKKPEPVVVRTPPKKIPNFDFPTAPAQVSEEKSSLNIYLIVGISLVLIAIVALMFLLIRNKHKELESQ